MNLVSRAEWGARPPTAAALVIQSEGTTGHWEGGGIWGGTPGSHASCASKVRAIQAYHMDNNGWTDIAYNVVACPHGWLFEGRGRSRRSAANGTNTANGRSAVCCYLGGVGDLFTKEGKQAMIDSGLYLFGDLIWGHRDWFPTQCPGDEIYNWIKAGHPIDVPQPPPVQEDDMTPGQCHDLTGDKWFFIIGTDKGLYARANSTGQWYPIGGLWASGVDAELQSDGTITICGKAIDGQLYQCTMFPAGSPHPGQASSFTPLGGSIA